ncbi:cyclic pyranopterin monophosphate synthase MoaC [Limnochorda pilosa]|uniref:Cyclic pyranopterin monophosphate synthase n=1 Tax=Limnochorda pilosa TaxID=1555112 RepID=A0A0K2SPC7_LIMPI|nr:cyclic pyranopterin monophosphate synthase MoaC [Limnochorda pilosa]BAS28659.1 molybdenum cofactor biosynthesis protein MoaC [Limnochorda pilosa]
MEGAGKPGNGESGAPGEVRGAGAARMVEVGGKAATLRRAVARGMVRMDRACLKAVAEGRVPKGDVLAVARVGGILAAKAVPHLIPLAHPIALTGLEMDLWVDEGEGAVQVEARVQTTDRTGVEMEALTAVSVACLTVYDMCKALDPAMVVDRVRLVEKSGGKSGLYRRLGEAPGETP